MIRRHLGGALVVFTTRDGGTSTGAYRSLNLAYHVGDDARAVTENRRRLATALVPGGEGPVRWRWLTQVHGAGVVADAPTDHAPTDHAPAVPTLAPAGRGDGSTPPPASSGPGPEGDASVTAARGVALGVLTADCAPVAIAGPRAAAAVHAGWRGLEAGVVEAAVAALRDLDDGPLAALVGPCIHAHHNEFGAADLDRLARRLGDAVRARSDSGRPAFDLPAGVTAALSGAGVERVDDVGVCTACSADLFSYRRDGVTGRQAMVVVR